MVPAPAQTSIRQFLLASQPQGRFWPRIEELTIQRWVGDIDGLSQLIRAALGPKADAWRLRDRQYGSAAYRGIGSTHWHRNKTKLANLPSRALARQRSGWQLRGQLPQREARCTIACRKPLIRIRYPRKAVKQRWGGYGTIERAGQAIVARGRCQLIHISGTSGSRHSSAL